MSQNDQRGQAAAPIGTDAPKSPADRARQIQEMQRAMETQQAAPVRTAQVAQTQQAQQTAQAQHVPDGFNVNQVNAAQNNLLTPKAKPADHAAYAQAQKGTNALFGGGATDIEIQGNPWKIIPFGDTVPALFDTGKSLADYEPVLPEKAVKTDQGLLFEMGLKAKKGDAPVQKKAVLVDAQGRLAGAECKSEGDVQRLLSNAPWLLPQSATQANAKWSVLKGDDGFALRIDRPSGRGTTSELQPLNNFGLPTMGHGDRGDIIVANYQLDRFDAGI